MNMRIRRSDARSSAIARWRRLVIQNRAAPADRRKCARAPAPGARRDGRLPPTLSGSALQSAYFELQYIRATPNFSVSSDRRSSPAAQSPTVTPRAILELRYYHLRTGRQVEKTTAYFSTAWCPAAERAGIKPFGCFGAVIAPDSPFMLTLASYPSMAAFDTAREKLAADKEFQTAVDDLTPSAS